MNEMVLRNGLITQAEIIATGSITTATSITGSLTGSHFGNTTGTASWATNSLTASNINFVISFSTNSTSASFASSSISSSYSLTSTIQITTGSSYPITSSWSTNSTTATTATTATSASYALSASYAPGTGGGSLSTGSTYPITSSWAQTASVLLGSITSASYALSASYAPSTSGGSLSTGSTYPITSSWALTASYISPYTTYTTDSTSSLNWITCSFQNPDQEVLLTITGSYNFTQSNVSATGQMSDLLLFISHSATNGSSSFVFPSNWVNLGTGWPSSISSSTVAVLWLRSIDSGTIIGTYNVSGISPIVSTASLATTASVANSGSLTITKANINYYVDFSVGSAGYQTTYATSSLIFNPATGSLTVSFISASQITSSYLTGSLSGTSNYASASFNGAFAFANFSTIGSSLTVGETRNITVSRVALGIYGFKFATSPSNVNYVANFCGCSGSTATPQSMTASIASIMNASTTTFSMSVCAVNSALVRADVVSGSVTIFGY